MRLLLLLLASHALLSFVIVLFRSPPPTSPAVEKQDDLSEQPPRNGCISISTRGFKNSTRWHCPPSYIMIGFPKAGSSSLHRWLLEDSRIVLYKAGRQKEAHFWHQPTAIVSQTFTSHLHAFPSLSAEDAASHVLGEHSPGSVWRVPWRCPRRPSNFGCVGSAAGLSSHNATAWNIRRFAPVTTKLLVILRDPVRRAYSHYWHWSEPCREEQPRRTPQCFEELALRQIALHRNCEQRYNNDGSSTNPNHCAWGALEGDEAWQMTPRMIALGLYVAFLEEWLLVIGRKDRFCVAALDFFLPAASPIEPLSGNEGYREASTMAIRRGMNLVGECLGLGSLSSHQATRQPSYTSESAQYVNRRGTASSTPKMLPSSRTLLEEFYAPYNARLLDLDLFLGGEARSSMPLPRWVLPAVRS